MCAPEVSGPRAPVRPPGGTALVGRAVRLDPLAAADAPALFEALDDERVWAAGYGGGPAGRPRTPAETGRFVGHLLTRPAHAAYTVRLAADGDLGPAGTVVGTSSLGDLDLANRRVHLGWTAYGPRWWASAVNPETKLLLLGHAFDDCGLERVKIQTDAVNERSQAAIARLGAVREGVLRHHVVRADGSWRDTVVFSVLRGEWPQVRAGLLARLGRPEGASDTTSPG